MNRTIITALLTSLSLEVLTVTSFTTTVVSASITPHLDYCHSSVLIHQLSSLVLPHSAYLHDGNQSDPIKVFVATMFQSLH